MPIPERARLTTPTDGASGMQRTTDERADDALRCGRAMQELGLGGPIDGADGTTYATADGARVVLTRVRKAVAEGDGFVWEGPKVRRLRRTETGNCCRSAGALAATGTGAPSEGGEHSRTWHDQHTAALGSRHFSRTHGLGVRCLPRCGGVLS